MVMMNRSTAVHAYPLWRHEECCSPHQAAHYYTPSHKVTWRLADLGVNIVFNVTAASENLSEVIQAKVLATVPF
jgi:hypothetical protein